MEVIKMVVKEQNTAVREYVEIQRERIAKSKNARRWFYRGVLAGAAALVVYARLTDNTEDQTEEN